jgi:hypothetical protein
LVATSMKEPPFPAAPFVVTDASARTFLVGASQSFRRRRKKIAEPGQPASSKVTAKAYSFIAM